MCWSDAYEKYCNLKDALKTGSRGREEDWNEKPSIQNWRRVMMTQAMPVGSAAIPCRLPEF